MAALVRCARTARKWFFGQIAELCLADKLRIPLAFGAPDGDMHPDRRDTNQHKQDHEAAGPNACDVVESAERDREHEAAESADHSHEAANRPNMVRVVDRDVLVDRCLAERHHEAEDNGQDDKEWQAEADGELDRPIDAADDVTGIG